MKWTNLEIKQPEYDNHVLFLWDSKNVSLAFFWACDLRTLTFSKNGDFVTHWIYLDEVVKNINVT